MKRVSLLLSILMVLVLAACSSGNTQSPAATANSAGNIGTQSSAGATAPVPVGTTAGLATESTIGTPAGTSAAPQSGSETPAAAAGTSAATASPAASPTPKPVAPAMTSLTGLMAYRVADQSGKLIGTINDLIINMCTDRIVYIVLAPDASLNMKNSVLVPYEVTTFQTVKSEDFIVVKNLTADQLSGAPAFDPATASLDNPTWVSATNAFWSKTTPLTQPVDCSSRASISSLVAGTAQAANPLSGPVSTAGAANSGTASPATTAGASTTGTTGGTYSLAYMRTLNFNSIVDTNGTALGAVNTVLVRPEDGAVLYFILSPSQAANLKQQYVPIPAPAISVRNAAGGAGTPQSTASGSASSTSKVLVLQVPVTTLQNAPEYNLGQNLSTPGWDQSVIQFWTTLLPTAQP